MCVECCTVKVSIHTPLPPTLVVCYFARYDDEQDNCCEDYMFTNMPPGSIIISDYRTVHRGTINLGTNPRPVAMYIYGRDWWSDRINYGRSDYGGLKVCAARTHTHTHAARDVVA